MLCTFTDLKLNFSGSAPKLFCVTLARRFRIDYFQWENDNNAIQQEMDTDWLLVGCNCVKFHEICGELGLEITNSIVFAI